MYQAFFLLVERKKGEEKREALSDEAFSASDFPIEQERLKESFISWVLLCDSMDNADYDAPKEGGGKPH